MKNLLIIVFSLIAFGAYSQDIKTKKQSQLLTIPPPCINTDPCNLVCNPHMEGPVNDCFEEAGYGCIYFTNPDCAYEPAISGWNSLFSGHYWSDAFSTCVPTPSSFYNINNHLPGDPGGSLAIRNLNGYSSDPDDHSGAFMTDVAVDANTRYILSFFRSNLATSQWYASTGYDVGLIDNTEITWAPSTYNVSPLASDFLIVGEDTIIGPQWEQMISCFTTDNNTNYDVLYFESNKGLPNTVKGIRFDHVELIEDRLQETPASYTLDCGVPTEIGIDLCHVTNMSFQWWDMSSNLNPTQITNGTTILNTPLPYSISDINDSGSIIELTDLVADVDLELRRAIPSIGQDNIPINGNCNSVASVSVISNCPQTSDCEPDNWPHGYGSTFIFNNNEGVNSMASNQNGDLYVKGRMHGSVSFDDGTFIPGNSFLAKYDNCGTLLWVNDVSAYGDEELNNSEIKVDNVGNVVMMSASGNYSTEDVEQRLTKFDGNGNLIWSNIIEQWRNGPRITFDIDQSTNDIYLIANVSKYLRIKDQSSNYIINYTLPMDNVYPRNCAYIVKFNPNGFQLWQDRLVSTGGLGFFEDVVVAEDLNQVYIMGVTSNHYITNCNIHLNSTPSNTLVPVSNNRVFLVNYASSGLNNYFQIKPTLLGYANSSEIEFSNTDSELYLRSYKKKLTIFSQVGLQLQTATLNFACNSLTFNQADNYLLMSGHIGNGNYRPYVTKYHRTDQIWSYTIGSSSRGIIYDAQPDFTSNKVFIGGSYFDNPLIFSPTVSLPFVGGRDAFVSRIKDEGTWANYMIINSESGIESTESNQTLSDVSIYPNPTNDKVTVQFTNPSSINEKVELVDLMGHQVDQRIIIDTQSVLEFDLQALPSGIYFIKIYSLDGTVEVKKIIKQD